MSLSESLDALLGNGDAMWGFVLAAVIVFVLTPAMAWLAPRIGALDVPTDRPRVHSFPVPRIGGVAIVAGILIPAFLLIQPGGPYAGILLGTLCVACLGLLDDIRGIGPMAKLVGVAAIALIPVVGYDVTIDRITLPLIGDHDIGFAAYPLTVLWIVVLANLINLIDGMDALAAGLVGIAAASFAVLAASFDRINSAALAMIVCGSTLAFLRHNYHPARIFMGDTGALALGFLLAAVAVQGVLKTAATIALMAPLLVVAVPILDTSFVVLKRLKYRRAPWGADHNHFYHRFMRIGFSQRRTAAYLHVWAALLAVFALLARFVPPRPGGEWDTGNTAIVLAAGMFVAGASIWMVYTLEILKARHLHALGLKRFVEEPMGEDAKRITEEFEAIEPSPAPPEEEDTLEHALTARLPESGEEPGSEAPPDHV
ncbi:MAG TPA: MraY family glycosyltransferase [Solirubrobacterales bacterium]|jgi:UDP-GlcNAc:undecaprenyl-phosphate GlcNAc-1-phosphate transferase|nr:MraY family glycosyltransferase [Solirubrobacterales bacterium]